MAYQGALRKPYLDKMTKRLHMETSYVRITLRKKNNEKLVVSFNSYNTILSMGDNYKCVVCDKLLDLDENTKDLHISTADHRGTLDKYPHDDEFSQHLIRKVNQIFFQIKKVPTYLFIYLYIKGHPTCVTLFKRISQALRKPTQSKAKSCVFLTPLL